MTLQTTTATANSKHNITPSQINVYRHTKANLPGFYYLIHQVQLSTNIQSMLKGKKKTQSEETKQVSEPDSDMVEILELLDQKF